MKANNLDYNTEDVISWIHINQYNTYKQNLDKKFEMLIQKYLTLIQKLLKLKKNTWPWWFIDNYCSGYKNWRS